MKIIEFEGKKYKATPAESDSCMGCAFNGTDCWSPANDVLDCTPAFGEWVIFEEIDKTEEEV